MDSPQHLTPRAVIIAFAWLLTIAFYVFVFPELANARLAQSTPPLHPLAVPATLAAQQQKLTASDGGRNALFGYCTAIHGDTLAVAAYGDEINGQTSQGSAYAYVLNNGVWQEQHKFVASDGEAGDGFGLSIGLTTNIVIIGAPNDKIVNNESWGSAYIFVRSGTVWGQQYKLVASDGAPGDNFGDSVAISGGTAIIGALSHAHNGLSGEGAAYVYVLNGSQWLPQAELRANDGASNYLFSQAVAIDGNTAVIGANGANGNRGAAYIFTRSGGVRTQQAKLMASDGAAIDYFGFSVAISGNTVVVGAFLNDPGGHADQGAAYVFQRSGTTWTQQAKLTAGDGAAGDLFGRSVTISGDTVVAGADQHLTGSNAGQGAAYVFTRQNSVWTQSAKLVASDGAPGDGLGIGVAVDGNTCVVGAWADDMGANYEQGSAYVVSIPCAPSLTPANAFFPVNGDEGMVKLNLPGGCAWTATSDVPWINISSQAAGSGSAMIGYVVRDNFTGGARSGTIQIAGQTFTVMQAGGECSFALTGQNKSFSVNGGTWQFNVVTGGGCLWRATTSDSWITFTSDSYGIGNSQVHFAVANNTSGKARKGTIVVGNRSFKVKQNAF
ncbi:MAG: hypothetical protein V7641_1687 [Blastocatellia bacterium]